MQHTNPEDLKRMFSVSAYINSDLSLGQLARALGKSMSDTAKILDFMNIPVIDYALANEQESIFR